MARQFDELFLKAQFIEAAHLMQGIVKVCLPQADPGQRPGGIDIELSQNIAHDADALNRQLLFCEPGNVHVATSDSGCLDGVFPASVRNYQMFV